MIEMSGNAEGFGYHSPTQMYSPMKSGSSGSPMSLMSASSPQATPHAGIAGSANFVNQLQSEGRNQAFSGGAQQSIGQDIGQHVEHSAERQGIKQVVKQIGSRVLGRGGAAGADAAGGAAGASEAATGGLGTAAGATSTAEVGGATATGAEAAGLGAGATAGLAAIPLAVLAGGVLSVTKSPTPMNSPGTVHNNPSKPMPTIGRSAAFGQGTQSGRAPNGGAPSFHGFGG